MPEYPAHSSKYFDIREFIHPKTWSELGQSPARCQWMIDPKVVRVCDLMRELVGGPVIVNDWSFKRSGKTFKSSGFRAKWDSTGAAYSQHRRGMAADLKCVLPPVSMLAIIQSNLPAFLDAGLTTIEDIAHTPTWLHIDCRPRLAESPDLLIIKP